MDRVFDGHDFDICSLSVGMKLSTIETIKNAVQANLGAAFVPRSAIDKEVQLGVLRPIQIKDWVIKHRISVVAKSGSDLSNPAKTFVQEVISQFALLGPD